MLFFFTKTTFFKNINKCYPSLYWYTSCSLHFEKKMDRICSLRKGRRAEGWGKIAKINWKKLRLGAYREGNTVYMSCFRSWYDDMVRLYDKGLNWNWARGIVRNIIKTGPTLKCHQACEAVWAWFDLTNYMVIHYLDLNMKIAKLKSMRFRLKELDVMTNTSSFILHMLVHSGTQIKKCIV